MFSTIAISANKVPIKIYFSQFWSLHVENPGFRKVPSFRSLTSYVLTWQKGQGSLSGLFYKGTNPFTKLHPHNLVLP